MRKLITISLAVLLMGLSAAVVYAAVQSGDDSVQGTATTATTETTETTTTTTTQDREREPRDDGRAIDVSGPCDEAEHANDPRCTGAVAPRVEDDQRVDDDPVGHDRGDDHGGDRHDEVEDHSGPGHGGDHGGGDDHSGSGHGGRDHEEDD